MRATPCDRVTGLATVLAAILLLVLAPAAAAQALDRPPQLVNGYDLGAVIDREYPPRVRAQHTGGTVRVRLRVDTAGKPDSLQVVGGSGDAPLDSAALRVAAAMRFTAAVHDGTRTALWVVLPIEFPAPPATEALPLQPGPARRIELLNGDAVVAAIRARYPDGSGGVQVPVVVGLGIDSGGIVRRAWVDTSGCIPYFDTAAVRVTGLMRFAPAAAPGTETLRRSRARLLFSDSGSVFLPGDSSWKRGTRDTVKHYTVAPELANRDAVRDALAANYPREMGLRGVGGTTVVWTLIDESGTVVRRQIRTSSGQCPLDLAALRVTGMMLFTPGMKDGVPVRVWVQLPLKFKVSG